MNDSWNYYRLSSTIMTVWTGLKDSNALTVTARDSFVATIFILSSLRLVRRASLTTYTQQEGWTIQWEDWEINNYISKLNWRRNW